MSKLQKLLNRIRNNPKTVRFEELDKILMHYGFSKRQSRKGSSHFVYKKGKILVTIPYKQPYIKVVYVEQVIKALEGLVEDEKNA